MHAVAGRVLESTSADFSTFHSDVVPARANLQCAENKQSATKSVRDSKLTASIPNVCNACNTVLKFTLSSKFFSLATKVKFVLPRS